MKARYIILTIILMLVPSIVLGANINYTKGLVCENEEQFKSGAISETNCTMGFTVIDGPLYQNHFTAILELTNIDLSKMQVVGNWNLLNLNSIQVRDGVVRFIFEFETPETSLTDGYQTMYKFKLTKIMTAQQCNREYSVNWLEKIDRSCTIFDAKDNQKIYYDSNGLKTTWKEYKKQCDKGTCSYVCNPDSPSECLYFDASSNVVNSEYEKKASCKEYKCENVNGQYFDNNGNPVTWTKYQTLCNPPKCDSVCNPNKDSECLYFNKDKQSVTEHDMKVSCNMYKCQTVKGKYYDNSGNEVTWEQYDKECNEHTCKRVCNPNNANSCLYYDKSGTNVNWQTYEKDCGSYTCKKVCEPNNNKNCLYYNKEGKVVASEAEMQKSCTVVEEVHKCEIKDSKFYNNSGLVVSWKDYAKDCETGVCRKICNPLSNLECLYLDSKGLESTELKYTQECLPHVCEQVGELYYDKNGDVVASEEEMKASCEERNYCEYKNGYYFNKNGEVTDKEGYEIECLPHQCEIIKDTFFDKDGNIVTEDEYNKSCNPPIENPQTGMLISLVGLVIVMGGGIYLFQIAKKHNKFM